MLEGLRRELHMHMHTHDLDRLRRFVSASLVVLWRNCTIAKRHQGTELGYFVPSAGVAKRRFRRWPKKSALGRLMQHSQPVSAW